MKDISEKELLDKARDKLNVIKSYIRSKDLNTQYCALNQYMSSEDVDWSCQEAISKAKEHKYIKDFLDEFSELESELEIAADILSSADELNAEITSLHHKIDSLYIKTLLSGKYDQNPCFINIMCGSGGTEAQDWASMLFDMYHSFGQKLYKVDIIDYTSAPDAGIKSAIIKFSPDINMLPYGMLKGETGVHRLVRKSPFNANGNRHTSFASVQVVPEVDVSDSEIFLSDADIRIDYYRASGAGGQHVNKTDSAVRITHIPTGIVTQSQNERSQHKNKSLAMSVLKSKLFALSEEKKKQELKAISGDHINASWGAQIRSYVLDSARIKDLRTNFESSRPNDVLSGSIMEFLEAYIRFNAESN